MLEIRKELDQARSVLGQEKLFEFAILSLIFMQCMQYMYI